MESEILGIVMFIAAGAFGVIWGRYMTHILDKEHRNKTEFLDRYEILNKEYREFIEERRRAYNDFIASYEEQNALNEEMNELSDRTYGAMRDIVRIMYPSEVAKHEERQKKKSDNLIN